MDPEFDRVYMTIRKLVDGTLTTYEWDDNMSPKIDNRRHEAAEALRNIAWEVSRVFPPPDDREGKKKYTSEKGLELFRRLLELAEDQVGKLT